MDQTDLRYILEKGILASSGDNMQPWRFVLKENALDLKVVPNASGHFFETANRTLYISAGGVIENMRAAAALKKYRLTAEYFPKPGDDLTVASVRFEQDDNAALPGISSDAIEKRCTNRRFYDPEREIASDIYDRMDGQADAQTGYPLIWIKRNDARYRDLATLIGDGDKLRFETKRVHLEFMESVRYGRKEVEETKNGLDVRSLEAGPGSSLAFRMFSYWPVMSALNTMGMSGAFHQYAVKQVLSSQAIGLVVAPGHEAKDYVRGGEVMQRVWNRMGADGVSMQPMEAIPVFLIYEKLGSCDDTFNESQRKKLQDIKKRFLELFGIRETNGLIMLFRAGYGKPPTARSLRRDVNSFIENNAG